MAPDSIEETKTMSLGLKKEAKSPERKRPRMYPADIQEKRPAAWTWRIPKWTSMEGRSGDIPMREIKSTKKTPDSKNAHFAPSKALRRILPAPYGLLNGKGLPVLKSTNPLSETLTKGIAGVVKVSRVLMGFLLFMPRSWAFDFKDLSFSDT